MVTMGNGIFIPNKVTLTGTMVPGAMLQPLVAGNPQPALVAQQPLMAGNLQAGLSAFPGTGILPNPAISSGPVLNQMFLMANNFSLAGSMLTQFSGLLQSMMQGLAGAQPQPSLLPQLQPQPLPVPLPQIQPQLQSPLLPVPLPQVQPQLQSPLLPVPLPQVQPQFGLPSFIPNFLPFQPSGTVGDGALPAPLGNLLSCIMNLLPNLMALAGPQVPPPVYNGGNTSRYWGDPHLVGFDGEQYDVMGQGGNIYNMLSDKEVQYNTTFVNWGKPGADGVQPTVIGEAGIQVGKNLVYFDRSGKAPTVDGKPMSKGEKIDLGDGKFVQWDGSKLIVKTAEYTIDLQVKQPEKNGGYIDSNVTINEGVNPLADGVNPHGLLGQTADGVKGARKGGDGNQNIQKQGGDVIDGVVDDYKVQTLWDNAFKYNRFQSEKESEDLTALLITAIQGLARSLAA